MKKSLEDIEIMKIHITQTIERGIEFLDALTTYQTEVYDPILKKPFCFNCGDPIEERKAWTGKPYKCDKCKREATNKAERARMALRRNQPHILE